MIRKVITHSLIGASLFIGATGTVIAIIALKKTHTNDSKYLNLNNTFRDMHALYGGSNDAPEITSANIDDLNKKIADNFEYLANKIDSSKEGMVEYFNNDLHTKMEKMLSDFKKDMDQETDRKLSHLSDDVADLAKGYRSLDERLIDTKETIKDLKENTDSKLEALKETSSTLQTEVKDLDKASKVNATNIKTIDVHVGRLTVKIVELNTKQSEMNTLIERNEDRILYLNNIITKVKADSSQNKYDINDLQTRVTKLESEQTKMEAEVKQINLSIDMSVHKMDSISKTVEDFKDEIRRTNAALASANDAKLAALLVDVKALETQAETNITVFSTFKNELNTFETEVTNLMTKNQKLEKDINYLAAQNHKLFEEMVKMQSAIKEVNQNVVKGSTMVVLNPNKKIYDSDDAPHQTWWTEAIKLHYPLINIPLLEKAKNISVILKMQDPSGVVKNFEVKAIDTFPTRGINLVSGFDTPGRTSFLMDMEIHDNDLVINHIWWRKYARHWQDIKKLDLFKVILAKIQIIY